MEESFLQDNLVSVCFLIQVVFVNAHNLLGKTMWLFFMFICLIMRGEPIAFYKGGTTQLFCEGYMYKAQVESEFPQDQIIWCLTDCDYWNDTSESIVNS